MIKMLRLKRKAPGLVIIAWIGIVQSLLPLYSALSKPSLLVAAFEKVESAWTVLRLPILFFLLWCMCFICVKGVQNKKIHSPFFETFNVWKGLALLLIWPSLMFWYQLLTHFYEAFDFLHPFTSLVFMHVIFLLFGVFFLLPFLFFLALKAKKPKKTDIKILESMKENMGPNLLWVRFFFREVSSDLTGKIISYFVGISYLIFFYATLLSVITPAALAVTTSGKTVAAHDVNYVWASKYGSHTGSYCLLDVNTDDKIVEFALNSCQPCVRQPGSQVNIKHHPFDYRNRRISSAECESSP